MKPTITALEVANEFIALAKDEGRDVTPMKLLKLVYFAYGVYLVHSGRSLFAEVIEAWKYGPVVRSLYHAFKEYGSSPVTKFGAYYSRDGNKIRRSHPLLRESTSPDAELAKQVVEKVWSTYKDRSAIDLSAMTHWDGSAWYKAYNAPNGGKDRDGVDVRDEDIAKDFSVSKTSSSY